VTVQEPAAFELDVAVPGEPVLRSETMTVQWDTSDVTLPVEIDVVVSTSDEAATTTATVECLDPRELSRDDPQAALCDDDHNGRDGGSDEEDNGGNVDEGDEGDVDSERDRVSSRVARSAP